MVYLLTTIHVVACLILVAVVLLQTGKRADLAGAFGGGGSQTAFGARGAATFLSKATTTVAVIFMLTSIALAISSTRSAGGGESVLEGVDTSTQGTPGPLPSLPDPDVTPSDAGTSADPAPPSSAPGDAGDADTGDAATSGPSDSTEEPTDSGERAPSP